MLCRYKVWRGRKVPTHLKHRKWGRKGQPPLIHLVELNKQQQQNWGMTYSAIFELWLPAHQNKWLCSQVWSELMRWLYWELLLFLSWLSIMHLFCVSCIFLLILIVSHLMSFVWDRWPCKWNKMKYKIVSWLRVMGASGSALLHEHNQCMFSTNVMKLRFLNCSGQYPPVATFLTIANSMTESLDICKKP